MSKQSKNKVHRKPITASPEIRRRSFSSRIIVLTVTIVVGLGFGWSRIVRRAKPVTEVSWSSSTPTKGAEFQKLKGRWQRPDGGYVIAINDVSDSGLIDATYFNPTPIHVAKAEASTDGINTKLVVELRDANYPGSTYALTYDPSSDQLRGIYFQAVEQQRFEVAFERMQ